MSAPHLPPVGPATASDVYTQLQETTVSTLSALTSIVDLSVVGEEEDPELPPLTSIFHCSMIKETSTNSQNGKISWLCKWCGKTFLPRHRIGDWVKMLPQASTGLFLWHPLPLIVAIVGFLRCLHPL